MRLSRRFRLSAMVCAVALFATGANAAGPGITLSSAALVAGRLVVAGTAATPGVLVTIQGTTFTARSNALRQFSFSVSYRTPDCKLTLVTSTGTLPILIGNCGPTGVNPKGNWNGTATYVADDLTLYAGATYRALRVNKNKHPDASPLDWQLFAAKGATGAQGPKGDTGDKGDPGDSGAFGGSVKREVVCRSVGDYQVVHGPIAVMYTCTATCQVNEIGLLGAAWQTDKVSHVPSVKTNAPVAHDPQPGGGEVSKISSLFESPTDVISFSYDQQLAIFCLPL